MLASHYYSLLLSGAAMVAQAHPALFSVQNVPQLPFTSEGGVDMNLFSGASRHISAALEDGYVHLSHSAFSDHRIRMVKPTKLGCDDQVNQWSGYLDFDNNQKHLFFWFFESRNDPAKDPVVLWLNGGPGCSSFTGLLQELGPCRIQPNGTDVAFNPYAFNANASMIFLDQPVGVGYSYAAKNASGIWSTPDAARDTYAFLSIFWGAFANRFQGIDFHMSGESFAGRYLPIFADYLAKQNDAALVSGNNTHVPLKSVLIGNGFTNPLLQYQAYHPYACSDASGFGPYVSEEKCDKMAAKLPRCIELQSACYKTRSSATCLAANTYCEKTQTQPYYDTGRNPYDSEKFGDYDEEEWIRKYLNRADVRHALGVDHEAHGGVKEFIGCSDEVDLRFRSTGDQSKPSYKEVADLLERGIAVLIYAGARDWICNWLGNQAWTLALEWSGKEDFNAQELAPWFVASDGNSRGGYFRTAGNFTFATIDNSGHFVPYDQPAAALAMATTWIHTGASAFTKVLSQK